MCMFVAFVVFVVFAYVVSDAFYSSQCILQSFRVWFHFDLVRNIIQIHPKGDLFHFFIEIFVTFFWLGLSICGVHGERERRKKMCMYHLGKRM